MHHVDVCVRAKRKGDSFLSSVSLYVQMVLSMYICVEYVCAYVLCVVMSHTCFCCHLAFSPPCLSCFFPSSSSLSRHTFASTLTHEHNPLADTPFPKQFKSIVKTIFKRLFRIYAHIYYSHAQEIVELGVEAHLNTAFKHFYLFIREFDLVDPKEMAPMQHHIDKINAKLGDHVPPPPSSADDEDDS